jgi:hypothetical protein
MGRDDRQEECLRMACAMLVGDIPSVRWFSYGDHKALELYAILAVSGFDSLY